MRRDEIAELGPADYDRLTAPLPARARTWAKRRISRWSRSSQRKAKPDHRASVCRAAPDAVRCPRD
jgi:hypothetical protein